MTADRIGVFGGTFDPPHNGHVALMAWAIHELGLDRMIVIPAGDPWQKSSQVGVTPAPMRLELTRAMVSSVGWPEDRACQVEVSDIEVRRTGPSYMIDTIDALEPEFDGELPLVVLGADAAAGLASWERAAELSQRCVIAWGARPGAPDPLLGPEWSQRRFDLPALHLDSTAIRGWAQEGRPLSGLVPEEVVSILNANRLYRVAR